MIALQFWLFGGQIVNDHQILRRPRAIGSWVIIVAVSVCGGGGNRVTPWGWQYGILRRLPNGDQTCEIGSNRKIGYPDGGDTPGVALLPVGSLNSRAGKIVHKAAS